MPLKSSSIKKKREIKTKEKETPEDVIELSILNGLTKLGFFCWKVEYPGRFLGRKYISAKNKFVLSGFPDVGLIEGGRSYYFEVKTKSEKTKILRNYAKYKTYMGKDKVILRYRRQILVLEKLRRNGGHTAFVDCLEDCLDLIRRVRKEAKVL